MCGIFGYIGKKQSASQVVLDGLRVLEYRGYDSWGVVVKDGQEKDSELRVQKKVGKIGDAQVTLPQSTIGIGHTRWATHGGVTVENAHPHLDCRGQIAVVHNGIVENYKFIKDDLIKHGHTFLSDTDTEVIVHLIEENKKKFDFVTAVRLAFNSCKGLSAIVVMDVLEDSLVAAKTGSPLIVGKNDAEVFIASDISALTGAKKALYLKDFEMVVLSQDKVELCSLDANKSLKPSWEDVQISSKQDSLGKYPHFMIKEISQQPDTLLHALQDKKGLADLAKVLKSHKKAFFIAAGTAYHAALAGVYMLPQANVFAKLVVASEFDYVESEIDSESLVVAFSQSGETIDVIEPLARAKASGATIASVVNVKGSTIQRMSDVSVLLNAGSEKAVASTKAYTAKLSVLLSLLYILENKDFSGVIEKISLEEKRLLSPKNIDVIKKLAKKLKNEPYMFTIGRRLSCQSALEAALKIKEVSYVHIEGLAGGELKHGSIALIEKGTPCIVFAPKDETYDSIMSNAMEIKARGGYIIGISPENSDVFDYFIEVKDLGIGSVLAQIIPVQLLAYYLALEKGITDPDKPRNLAKSVTVK